MMNTKTYILLPKAGAETSKHNIPLQLPTIYIIEIIIIILVCQIGMSVANFNLPKSSNSVSITSAVFH